MDHMEVCRTIFCDRIQEVVAERLTTSDLVAYAAKWNTLRISVDSVLQNLKYFTFETVASTSQRYEQLEEKLVAVADKQHKMDTQLLFMVAKQNAIESDIKAILKILKKIPYTLGLVPFDVLYC